jgi:predicted  nucleic acid-binding Zn-ribbon protein
VEQLTSLSDLLDLHDIDLAIDHLLDERNSLPELESYRTIHGEVDRLDADLAQARVDLKQADLSLDKTNGELEIAAEKAAAEQNRLYAGGMSARDADYVRREVDMLYGKVKTLEDDVLMYMEAKEAAEQRVAGLEEELAIADAEKQRLSGVIREQWKAIDAQIALKEERKAAAITLVDEDLLETYDELRSRRSGRVVGRLVDGVCGACHLKLSAAEVARTSKEHPPRCIHCRAILVV